MYHRGAEPGRHHLGIPGNIISECPGDFVGIRSECPPPHRFIDSTLKKVAASPKRATPISACIWATFVRSRKELLWWLGQIVIYIPALVSDPKPSETLTLQSTAHAAEQALPLFA
jgi:hypothetical protein